jgi:hypothetical protein
MAFGKQKIVTTKVVGEETPDTHKVTHQKVISAGAFSPPRLGMCVNNVCNKYNVLGKPYSANTFKEDVIKLYDDVVEIEMELKSRI